MSINHVTVSGNLTRDPEVRTTASGKPVMSFGIAVNDRRRVGRVPQLLQLHHVRHAWRAAWRTSCQGG